MATLARLLRALLAGEGIEPAVPDPAVRLTVDGFGARHAFTCHLAERGGQAIAYAPHWPIYDTGPAERGIYLSDIYVTPTGRRSGVARALLGAVARHGRSRGARYMEWKVRQENAAARAFYATFAEECPAVLPMMVAGDAFTALAAAGRPIA